VNYIPIADFSALSSAMLKKTKKKKGEIRMNEKERKNEKGKETKEKKTKKRKDAYSRAIMMP